MRFVIPLFGLTFMTVFGLGACSADTPTPNDPPSSDSPAFDSNYSVMAEESQIAFSAEQEGVRFEGRIEDFSAQIRFDPDNLETSQVRVTIPIASLEAGSTDRNSTLPSKVWFDSRNFPEAVFASADIRQDGDGYIANGTLRMKGIENPLSLPFTLSEDAQGRTLMRSEISLNRTDWSIGEAPWDTDEYVSRNVSLEIYLVAEETD